MNRMLTEFRAVLKFDVNNDITYPNTEQTLFMYSGASLIRNGSDKKQAFLDRKVSRFYEK